MTLAVVRRTCVFAWGLSAGGCGGDASSKASTAVDEVRPVSMASADGGREGWFTYGAGAHIHATSREEHDHTAATSVRVEASLDAWGFWSEVVSTRDAGAAEVEALSYDPTSARLGASRRTADGVTTEVTFHYDAAGRLVAEDRLGWEEVDGRQVLDYELSRVFPLAVHTPPGNHGDHLALVVREVRYSAGGQVLWRQEATEGSVDQPTRVEVDADGDGRIDWVSHNRFTLDSHGQVVAFASGCGAESCDQPEQERVAELEDGRLVRVQLWEPTSSTGGLDWRSTLHLRWEAHPLDGPTGPHLDLRSTTPDDTPLAGWTERSWDARGWTTTTYSQAEEVVDVVRVETERVTLPLR